jgi:rhamnose transport system substrate-binding protein
MKKFLTVLLIVLLFTLGTQGFAQKKYVIGLVCKTAGNPFFEAVNKGAQEAAKELGITVLYQSPAASSVQGQIDIINSMIAQKVNAICVSANDPDALVPVCRKAQLRGIPVVTFDSAVKPQGRKLFVNQADMEQIGRIQVQLLAKMINYEGEIAILSAASTMANQNTWIAWMKEELKKPEYSKMKLVAIVYGDDIREKSYNEAMGLFKSYPNLKGIIAPTTVGIAAAARAIEDAGLSGKVQLTGLGLPSEMAEYVKRGTCKAFALWNPIDLGYATIYATYRLLTKEIKGNVGEKVNLGKLGERKIVDEGNGGKMIILGPPFVFDASNIDYWSKVY